MKRKKCVNGYRLCCVSTCGAIDNGSLTYHQFPKPGKKVVIKNPLGESYFCDRRKIWEDRVAADFVINKYSKVCSMHFTDEDYSAKTRRNNARRRLLPTAVPSLYLPYEECSAFTKFKQTPALLGDQVAAALKSCKLRRRSVNCRNVSHEKLTPVEKPCTSSETYCYETNERTQELCPNTELTAPAVNMQQNVLPETSQGAMFEDKYPRPPTVEGVSESAIFENVVIFKTEEIDIFENDIKEEIKVEQSKNECTKQEDEEYFDMLLMQTSYEMEKFTSNGCTTFSFI